MKYVNSTLINYWLPVNRVLNELMTLSRFGQIAQILEYLITLRHDLQVNSVEQILNPVTLIVMTPVDFEEEGV